MRLAAPRRRLAALLRRLASRLDGESAPDLSSFDLLPKGQYDYVPKGTHLWGPIDRFLLVPKNRYRVTLLPGQARRDDQGVGWITEDNTAEGYDLLWGNAGRLAAFRAEAGHVRDRLTAEIVAELLPQLPPRGRVVDIGCGVGDLLVELGRYRPDLEPAGMDFSAAAIAGARVALPHGAFLQAEIGARLPYDDGTFDVVLCTDVLEHLDAPAAAVAELARICKAGGLVAIVVPDGDVDTFLGHCWFWNQASLGSLLAPWGAGVRRLPQTREFLATFAGRGGP